jgi:hypothetical protein
MARIFKPKFPQRQIVLGPDGKPVMVERIAARGRNKGKPVFVPKRETVRGRDGKPKYQESKKWHVEYRDALGIVRRAPGYTSRRATSQLAAELERKAEHEESGLIDRYVEHRKRPLSEHVQDWRKSLLDRGATRDYAELSVSRVSRLLRGVGARFWPELDANRVSAFLASLREDGPNGTLSIESTNHYLRRVKQFARWMVKSQRAPENPLECLALQNSRTDRRTAPVEDRAEQRVTMWHVRRGTVLALSTSGGDWLASRRAA